MMIDRSQGFKDMLTLVGEASHGIDEVPARMGEAVGQHDAEALRHIAGEGIAHLDGRVQPGGSVFEEIGHVLPRMFSAGEEERHAMAVIGCQDGGGEDCLAGGCGLRVLRIEEGEDFHGGIIIEEEVSLCPQPH